MPDTGAPWNIPYVAGTDLVADWPTDSQSLANAIASGLTAAGTVKQMVTATDTSDRTTTSTSFTDASISVSITPESATSTLYVLWSFSPFVTVTSASQAQAGFQITDSSNAALTGAEDGRLLIYFDGAGGGETLQSRSSGFLVGVVASTDTSARTYKGRFKKVSGASTTIENATNTGRMIIMEVE